MTSISYKTAYWLQDIFMQNKYTNYTINNNKCGCKLNRMNETRFSVPKITFGFAKFILRKVTMYLIKFAI